MLEESEATTRPWWRTRPFLIMVLAGLFHLGRGAPVDGVVFLAGAGALALAEQADPAPPRDRDVPAAAVLIAVPVGWVVAMWQPATVPVALVVVATGPPMLYLALRRGGHAEHTDAGTWWPWAAVGVAVCLWELTSFVQQSDVDTANPDHPTLSAILEPVFAHNPGRAVMIVVWLAAGIVLARLMMRGSRPCTR